MSFVNKPIGLTGTPPKSAGPLRVCSKCERERVPEGGIEIGPAKWICASCWSRRASTNHMRRLTT